MSAGTGPLDGPSSSVDEQIEALMAEKASRSPTQRKIDSDLLYEIKRERNDELFQVVPDLQTRVTTDGRNMVLVDIDATVGASLLERIVALGGEVVNSHPRYRAVRARLPIDAIEQLATSPNVTGIRPADRPVTRKIDTSEGDVAHRADVARATSNVTGAGVKACVMSDSVDALGALQASGDLPAVSVLPGQSGNPGTSEGTAMLEIVHDLAPGATLGYATATGGRASFAQNILDLRASGCHVIVDDIGYFTSPSLQDGPIAAAVDEVVADGALYFSAAGNDGNATDGTSGAWEGDFQASGAAPPALGVAAGTIHDFGDGSGANTVTAGGGTFVLQWADPLGGSTNDYDLYLLDATGTSVVLASTDIQDGDDNPIEFINGPDDATGMNLAVALFSGSPRYLHLNSLGGRLDQATGGSIYGQPAAEGAFAVAAVDQATALGGAFTGGAANPVRSFSSDGPRRLFFDADGNPYTPGNFSSTGGTVRQKPDIAAADGVTTATPGFSPFPGTSAAAPHAAAIAALMLEANPTLSTADVDGLFASHALDIDAPGVDRVSGYGLLDAAALVEAIPPPPPPTPDVITVDPARVLDTRVTGTTIDNLFQGGGKLAAREIIRIQVAGRGGVDANAVGVEVNLTAIDTTDRGFATLFPCTQDPPNASTVNYTPGVNIANATTVALNNNGELCLYSHRNAHYAIDVLAYISG
ncbi:MAG: S8 family serine peptidase [Actinomycetota bacterium]